MKKLILIMLLISVPCYADMSDFFTKMNTVNVTEIAGQQDNQIYGIYSQPMKSYMFDAAHYFKENGSVLREWEQTQEGVYCSGVILDGKLYAVCVQENIVAIQPLTLGQ